MDVSDMDAVMGCDADRGGRRGDGVRRSLPETMVILVEA